MEHKLVDSGIFVRSKYIYYQSALLFAERKYKLVLSLLNKSLEIEKDKTRWNISLRRMNITLQSWISSIPWMAKQQIVSFSYYENLNIVLDFTIIARFLFVLLGYSDHFLAANSRNHSNNNTHRPFVFETHLCNSGN